MARILNPSDIFLIRSDRHAKCVVCGPAQTPPPARAWPTPNRANSARFTDRDLQALWPPNCHCIDGPGHGPKRYLSTVRQTGERPRLGYVPNATPAQVAEFLGNYRKLQQMLNEICAINAELLRRRERID